MSETQQTAGQPKKEKLPVFKTFDDCLAYALEKRDNFYPTAFMLL
jgi:hypothetical protein